MDESAAFASFSDFATNKGWDASQLVAAQSVYTAIQTQGPDAVMAPTPTPDEDKATIAKANELLAKDATAYWADADLQEAMFEALERQTGPQGGPDTAPRLAPSGDEIERRIGRQDMQKFETMMREEAQKYWGSPQLQAAYRDAIERANTAPPEAHPASGVVESAPAPAAEPKPEAA
jgi:hypothetical protein